jgi:hypothetical protein
MSITMKARHEQLTEQLHSFTPKKSTFFASKNTCLHQYLTENLLPNLNFKEIINYVAVLESIKIEKRPLATLIHQENYRLLHDLVHSLSTKDDSVSTLVPKAMISEALINAPALIEGIQKQPLSQKDTQFIVCLMEIHDSLLNAIERNFGKTHQAELFAENTVDYTHEMIRHSQTLMGIEVTTKQATLPDQATIMFDVLRQNVSINGQTLALTDEESIKKTIEEFTGDEITSQGSKANKLFYFCGQHLHACLLEEFSLVSKVNHSLAAPQINHGHISLTEKNGKITIEVLTKVLSLNIEDSPYILDTQGNQLTKITDTTQGRGEQILIKLPSEAKQKPSLRSPVGYVKGTFQLEQDPASQEFYLQPQKISIGYNAPELTYTKDLSAAINYTL